MTTLSLPRSLSLLALTLSASALSIGCAAPIDSEEENVDDTSEAVSSSWLCDVNHGIQSERCKAVIEDMHAQAAAVGRERIVDRGIWRFASGVTYDRARYEGGYRRDCSGFVSMAWEFEENPSTAYFPPFVSGKFAVELGSIDELAPGDALNKTFRNPYGHVMLFGGWASADHSQLYLMHHYATGKPAALIQVSRSALGDFIPVRSVDAPPVAAVPQKPAEPPPAAPEGCGVMKPGAALGVNQGLTSCDGRFTLIQQEDGNLVLYMANKGAIWASGTAGTAGRTAVMQGDGNLVVYTPDGKPVWDSGTWGHPGAWLAVQDDGNVVLYEYGAIWSTKTSGH